MNPVIEDDPKNLKMVSFLSSVLEIHTASDPLVSDSI